ncbi:MAG: AraC family transcriptional regulator, partial [Sphaerochaetaceae bacterium]|nr:AraC family transcriptional regulator [Sphaerochaetaceae bacterium]
VQLQSRLSEFIHQLKQEATDEESARQYPLEQEEQLQDAIRWGDRKEAQRIMNELLGKIYFVDGNSMDRITFRVMELISLLSRAAIQGGAPSEEIMEISYRCQREIGYYSSIEGMSLWLSKVLHQYTDLVFASMDAEYGTIISQALRFIRKHYQGRITLEETAAAVSLSVPYFSRLFNEKMRISFSSYVNRLRVEQAERLLLNTNLSLVDIAGMVGFEDQSYFSKVFKGVTTITPGQYRRRAGRFPSDNQEIHERPSQRKKS